MVAGMTVRVLLAEDEALVRAGFRVLLERAPDVEVVAEAADGDEAIELTRRHRPDVEVSIAHVADLLLLLPFLYLGLRSQRPVWRRPAPAASR
jgi:CheY-like chemotaxis protein